MGRNSDDYSKRSNDERNTLVERIFIMYPRLRTLLDQMEHCRTHSKLSAEPECMFIGGLSGAGKTTLQEYYARPFPRIVHEEGSIVPVLCATVPNRATDKTLVTELLRELGDPASAKGSAHNQTTRLRGLMDDCRVEISILDEFQHFADKDSKKILKTVSDWLKNLIDQTRRPIIMCGMPYASVILDAPGNEQLQRRFSVRASLAPFYWTTNEEKGEFRAFLKAIDDKLPFPERSRLAEQTMALRFYCGTNGRVGKVMKIVRRASELAIERGLEKLDLEVLSEAYADRLQADQPGHMNPFSSDKSELEIAPFREFIPDFGSTTGRSNGKPKEEKASAILKKK
jgi:hypothetical protein